MTLSAKIIQWIGSEDGSIPANWLHKVIAMEHEINDLREIKGNWEEISRIMAKINTLETSKKITSKLIEGVQKTKELKFLLGVCFGMITKDSLPTPELFDRVTKVLEDDYT